MNSSPISIKVFAKISIISSAPSPPIITCSGVTFEYLAISSFNSFKLLSGYLKIVDAFFSTSSILYSVFD